MPKLTLQDLDRELRNKNLRSVYLIYGPENYLSNSAVTRIRGFVEKLSDTDQVELDRLSTKDTKIGDVINNANTIPMWSQHRLIIVSEAGSIKEADQLERYLKKPSPTSTIVFTAEKIDGRTKFAQIIAGLGASVECKSLYDNQVPSWVQMEAKQKGKAISMEAARFMADIVGRNLGELASGLDKLMLFVGNKPVIDVSDVETVLTETSQKTVFEFANAVGVRNLAQAVHILKRLSAFRESEVMVLSMLARHWRLLIKAKEAMKKNPADIARILGVHPFFAKDYALQSKNFKVSELRGGFKRLYNTDKLLKSSKVPKWMILERCVRDLIN